MTLIKFERNVNIRTFDVLFVFKLLQNVHLEMIWPLWSPKKDFEKSFLPSLIRLQSKATLPLVLIFQKMDDFVGLFEKKDRKVYWFQPLLP